MRRKTLAILTGTVVVALLAAACTGGTPQKKGGTKIKEGGTLRIGTNSTIDSLNPFVAFNQDAYTMFEYIYPYLVQYDTRTLDFAPSFATSWETSTDLLTWTFHTVPGAKWSDGQPLTAKDAAWTINTILQFADGPTANSAGYLTHVTGAETTDDNTLVIHYEAAVANVLSQLQQMSILPQHVWEQYATGKGTELKTFKNDAPVVSGGPFQLTKFQKDDIALFQKNPNFFGAKPHIDGFGLQMFSNDDAMIQAMKNGELDALDGGGGTLPPTSIDTIKNSGWVVSTGPGLTEYDFIINSNPKKPKNRELLDLKVKEAFAHAIDRQQIIEVVWVNQAQPAAALVPPADGKWHNGDLKPETFDLDTANQLLDQAGFAKGSDGIRVADGHPMSYQVITPTDLTGVDRTFQIIQADFAKIGVKLSQRPLDSTAAFAEITAPGDTGYLNFDLALWDWVPLVDPDFILSVLTCDQYGGWSDSGYCDPSYDDMYKAQGVATSEADRLQIVHQMQQKVYDDRPYIFLVYTDIVEAHSKQWDGLLMSPQSSFNPLSTQSMTQVHLVG